MANTLWKPVSESNGNLVFLTAPQYNGRMSYVDLVGPGGQTLERGRYTGIHNNNRGHWRFSKPGGRYPSGTRAVVRFDNGGGVEYNIANPGQRYDGIGGREFTGEYQYDASSEFPASEGVGVANGSDIPLPGGAVGGGSAGAGALPFYLTGGFPQFPTIEFPGVDQADYSFTDPLEFGRNFTKQQNEFLTRNFETGRGFALDALRTELAGLREYAPAAAALSREQTALDQSQNQRIRTEQVDEVLPQARGQLERQRQRAETYAAGRVPDDILDRSLEYTTRSAAADRAGFGGFGARSPLSRDISDIMSVEQRLNLANYGEQLLDSNLARSSEVLLAPTAYANTGAQISPTPEVGAGRLAYQGFGALNQANLLSPATALSSTINQNQFQTNLAQRVNELNTEGQFRASTFNANGLYQSAVGQFQYDASYLSSLQAVNQANLNTATALEFQGIQNQAGANTAEAVENAQTIADTGTGTGSVVSGLADIVGGVVDALSPDAPASPDPSQGTGVAPKLPSPNGTTPISQPAARVIDAPDPSVPGGYRLNAGAQVPKGFTQFAQTPQGQSLAVRNVDYASDLERFAKLNQVSGGNSIPVSTAARADQTVSNAAQISYIPIAGFQPIGSTSSGRRMYAPSTIANSGNSLAGTDTLMNSAAFMAQLGIGDPSVYDGLSNLMPEISEDGLDDITNTLEEEGKEAGAANIISKLFGGEAVPEGEAGDLVKFAAMRIADNWNNFSPEQKSKTLAALAPAAIEAKIGKPLETLEVDTPAGVAGSLKLDGVARTIASGKNGMALARNWSQLSAIGNLLGKTDTVDIAGVADAAGFLGFGPQGAAVKVDTEYLSNVGATAAPQFGVGAMVFDHSDLIPKGYRAVSRTPEGQPVAMPENLIHTSSLTTGGPAPAAFKTASKVAARKHKAQKIWREAPAGRNLRGSAGGSAIVSGMQTMLTANPSMAGSITAYSLFKNTHGRRTTNA